MDRKTWKKRFARFKRIRLDQAHVQTLVHGTLGYIDPEYFRSSMLTEKSDVYSLAWCSWSCSQILDDRVKKDGIDEHVKCVAKLAKECVDLEGKKRPNMKEVKEELNQLRHCMSMTTHLSRNYKIIIDQKKAKRV
ncbi:putative non-specific serine/threonine protein kinase [Helianthus debilis subsp. tardiflorus]